MLEKTRKRERYTHARAVMSDLQKGRRGRVDCKKDVRLAAAAALVYNDSVCAAGEIDGKNGVHVIEEEEKNCSPRCDGKEPESNIQSYALPRGGGRL